MVLSFLLAWQAGWQVGNAKEQWKTIKLQNK
ncbi:MAG: hypothetical protein ACI9XB_004973, partial [Gammaproteobacteria bacterium]